MFSVEYSICICDGWYDKAATATDRGRAAVMFTLSSKLSRERLSDESVERSLSHGF